MKHQVCHAHCPKPGGDGLLVLAAVLALVLALALYGAAREAGHVLAQLIPWVSGVIIAICASLMLGYAGISAVRARRSHATDRQTIPGHAPARRWALG